MSRAQGLTDRLSLVVVTDPDCGAGRDLVSVVRAALQGGAPSIQLRAKRETTRQMLELARRLRVETRDTGTLLFINDRLDVALAVEADGAHVGDDDLPVEVARRIVPSDFLLGVSVDSPGHALAAERAGADYVGAGPVYATPSKTDAAPAIGLEGIAAVRAATSLPVVAIGGIDESNARAIAAAGAHGVAVIRAVMQAEAPEAAARALVSAVRRGLR